jgi:arsenate reductase
MPDAQGGLILYGITPCDQVRRARHWLDSEQVPYRFHDFRRDGLDARVLRRWLTRTPWDTLVNRKSTTWRALAPAERPLDVHQAERAMLSHPTLIKRPVLEKDDALVVGFSEADYQRLLRPNHDH